MAVAALLRTRDELLCCALNGAKYSPHG
eukprot:COSAG01_NODE_71789_length_254_cov_1187.722581_1_plen_27_part_01